MNKDCIDIFKSKNIALIGNKKNCKYFYLQFFSILQIKYYFSTNVDEDNLCEDPFFEDNRNVEYMPFRDSFVRKHDLLLILCVERGFQEPYDTMLFHKGFEWGSDYIDYTYVVQYYRHLCHVNLKERNLWIFGAGNNGKCFYERYHDIYNIYGFISNYESEDKCLGLPVIRPESLLKQDDFYVVICSDAAEAMAEKLCGLGLQGSHEFGFEINLPKFFFIAMGTCQIIKVGEFLCENKNFFNQYHMELYFDNAYEPCSDADNRRLKAYGKFCDAVLYSTTGIGSIEFRNFAPLVDRFYQKAEKFFMPFYYFKGQLIQATDKVNEYTLKPCNKGYFWFRGDQEINRLIDDGNSVDEIMGKISDAYYWSEQEIWDNFKRELKKVSVLDRFSSFSIRPFIEENYRKMLVFIDGTHFGYQLCLYLANQIARRLHVKQMDDNEIEQIKESQITSVMPLYPCVKRVLKIEIVDCYQFYNMEENELYYLDFREHTKRYVEYVLYVRKMYGEIGTIMAW